MTHVAYIYGYFFEGRCRYVGQARNVERRHQGHLKGESGFETFLQLIYSYNPIRPVILETVTGTDHKDLVFNLAWAEAVLMFKHHTYRPVLETRD